MASNSKEPIKCVSLNNEYSQPRTVLVNVNSNEIIFYPFTLSVNISSESCNNINCPYARVCVPDKVKNMNVKVFDLISRVNETRFSVQCESC